MRTLSFLSASIFICTLAACGESHDATDDGGGGDGAVAGSDGGGGSTDGGGGAVDGGGTSIDGGGIGVDAGETTDGGGGVTTDGGPVDAGSAMTITCGMTTCDARTEQCCIGGGPSGASAMCIPIGDMCMGGTATCDGPEDCAASEVCCGRGSGGGGGGGFAVSCVAAAMCGGGFTSFELCHAATDCSDSADMCCPIALMGISGSFCSPRCFGVMP